MGRTEFSNINQIVGGNGLQKIEQSKVNNTSFCASTNPIGLNSSLLCTNSINRAGMSFRAQMTSKEVQMYNTITSIFAKEGNNSEVSTNQKLAELLKSGKLLDSSSNDKSTTLENIYKILTTPRVDNISPVKIAQQTINMIYKPSVGTQRFGDIPSSIAEKILTSPNASRELKNNPELMNVKENGSGTCPVGSLSANMAHRMPSEYARWINELSSPDMCVTQNLKLSSLTHNPLDALSLLKSFNAEYKFKNFNEVELKIRPDKNARIRANIQADYYDPGERSIVDVLMQSALMNLGSEQTYNSLTDTTQSQFNPNKQGLIEYQKTFVESVAKNKEMLSIVYQNIDDNQVLTGYRCDFSKIKEHILKALNDEEDVIVGYIATDENNKVIGGHEITIVGHRQDENGKTVFICNDTDDDSEEFVEYKEDWLLPKIHHAGYPAYIVKNENKLLYAS